MNTSAASMSKSSRKQTGIRRMIIKLSRKLSITLTWRPRARVSHLLAMMLAAASGPALALPTDGQVVAGGVDIAQTTDTSMTITQSTDKGIINWRGYSVYENETLTYLQPSTSSVTLNRVTGGDASEILGHIVANGQIFLINPNGVLFGANAQLDVGGLVASTLDISNDDFLAGRNVFQNSGGAGSVVNQGNLNGKYVALLGTTVSNSGTITANGGTVALAAGDRVSLDISGDSLLTVSVDAAAAGASINHSGAIVADGGQVYITAKSADALMDTVLNVSGLVRAQSLSDQNGVIRLDGGDAGVVSVSGTLDASSDNGNGGTVVVTGDKVGLFEGARIDASGATGGGTVLVGGNYQGQGPEHNASMTYVAAGASIDASATGNGNGGTVVVWSQDATRVYGGISVRGGALGGNGGLVETSSHGFLDVTSAPDLSAALGQGGLWLIDPSNLTITNGTPGVGDNYTGTGTVGDPFLSATGSSIIYWTTINTALGSGDVHVTTVGSPDDEIDPGPPAVNESGTITIAGAGALTGTNDLYIDAADTITVNSGATITMGGVGSSLFMSAANGITINANITTANSVTDDLATGSIGLSTTDGDIAINATLTTGNATVPGAGANQDAITGGITVTAGGNGSVLGTGRLVTGNATVTGGGTTDTATSGSIVLSGNEVSENGSGYFDVHIGTATGSTTPANNVAGTLAVTTDGIGSAGEILIASDAALRLGVLNTLNADATTVDINVVGGALTLVAGSDLDLDNLTLTAAGIDGTAAALVVGGTTNLVATGNDITLDNAGNNFGAAVSSDGANVTLVDADALVLGASTVTGALDVTAGGNITQTGALAVTGTTNLVATGFDITLDNTGNSFGDAVSSDGINITLVAAGALDLGTTTATGDLDVTAGGAITDSGDIAVTGLAAFDAGSFAITLGDDNGDANTNFGSLSAAGGAIDIAEDSDMSIVNVSGTTVVLGSSGNMIDGGGADPNIVATTSLELNATGAIGEFDQIEVSSSDITATAGGAIKLANAATALTTIDLSAGGTGAIQFDQTGGFGLIVTSATTNDGSVDISNTGADMTVGTVTAGNGGALNLTTVTSGNLLDDNDDGTTYLSTTGTITLTVAGTSIGASTGTGDVPSGYLDIDAGATATVVTNGPTSAYFNLIGAGGTVLSSYFAGFLPASATDLGIGVADQAFNFDDNTFGTGALTNLTIYATSIGLNSHTIGEQEINVSGTATLVALTGAITDLSDTDTNPNDAALDITANTLNMTAVTGIGSADAIETAVANLSVASSTSGNIQIANTGDVVLTGVDAPAAFTLTATGAISDGTDADISVVGNASFTGSSISLANDAGDILDVGGTASFDAGAGAITVAAAGTVDFGKLTFNTTGGAVSITEDSATQVTGTNTADSLTLVSAGALTDDTDTSITVDNGDASLTATSISLANDAGDVLSVSGTAAFDAGAGAITVAAAGTVDFGKLTFNTTDGAVSITEDSATQVTGTNTADSLTLVSAGALTDDTATSITVDNGAASFTATSISLADDAGDVLSVSGNAGFSGGTGAITVGALGAVNFGSLTFATTGAVSITEDSDTVLTGANTANSLVLASSGSISDDANADLAVTGNASLSAGTSIILGDAANNDVNFGSVTLNTTAGNVDLTEDSAMSIAGTSVVHGDLTLTGPGNIDAYSSGGSLTVTGDLNVTAPGGFAWFDYYTGAGNDYQGVVNITARDSIYVLDKNDLELGVISSTTNPYVYIGAYGSILNTSGTASVNAPNDGTTVFGTAYLFALGGGIAQAAVSGSVKDPTGGIYFTPATQNIYVNVGASGAQAALTFDTDVMVEKMGDGVYDPASGNGQVLLSTPVPPDPGKDPSPAGATQPNQLYLCSLNPAACTDAFTGDVFYAFDVGGILNAAAQDLFNATFGTDNIRVAIQNGFLTEFGVVPPGIDAINGEGVMLPGASQALVIDPPPFLIDEEELKRRATPK